MFRESSVLAFLAFSNELLHPLCLHLHLLFLILSSLRWPAIIIDYLRTLNSPISIFYLVDLAARIMVSFPRIVSFPFPSRKQFGSIASVFGAGQRPQYLCRLKSALRIRRRASGYEFFLPLESFIPFHRLITLSILIGTSFENHSFLPFFRVKLGSSGQV